MNVDINKHNIKQYPVRIHVTIEEWGVVSHILSVDIVGNYGKITVFGYTPETPISHYP